MISVNSSSLPSIMSAQSTSLSGAQKMLKLPVAPTLPKAIPVPESIEIAEETVVLRSKFCRDKTKEPSRNTKKKVNIKEEIF